MRLREAYINCLREMFTENSDIHDWEQLKCFRFERRIDLAPNNTLYTAGPSWCYSGLELQGTGYGSAHQGTLDRALGQAPVCRGSLAIFSFANSFCGLSSHIWWCRLRVAAVVAYPCGSLSQNFEIFLTNRTTSTVKS